MYNTTFIFTPPPSLLDSGLTSLSQNMQSQQRAIATSFASHFVSTSQPFGLLASPISIPLASPFALGSLRIPKKCEGGSKGNAKVAKEDAKEVAKGDANEVFHL